MTTEYSVVSNEALTLLEKRVNELCEQGWRPLGGICAIPARRSSDGETIHAFYQAMTYEHAE